jgi:hypothetical protein
MAPQLAMHLTPYLRRFARGEKFDLVILSEGGLEALDEGWQIGKRQSRRLGALTNWCCSAQGHT